MKVFVGQPPSALNEIRRNGPHKATDGASQGRQSAGPAGVVRHPGLQSLVSHVHDADEQDARGNERVEALKQAIAEGRYQINATAVADALIEETARVHGIE